MTDYGSMMVLLLVLVVVFQGHEARSRIRSFREALAERDLMVNILLSQNRALAEALGDAERDLSRRSGTTSPHLPDSVWHRRWAREVLRLPDGPITRGQLRSARRAALKSAHPDVGGSAKRIRCVEEAVSALGGL